LKLGIVQIMMGFGIFLVMAVSIACDSRGFYILVSLKELGGWQCIFNPDTKEVVATILAYLVLPLGLLLIGVSVKLHQMIISGKHSNFTSALYSKLKKSLVIQIILGLLLSISAFLVFIWGFPTYYEYTFSGHGYVFSLNPGYQFILAQLLSGVVSILAITSAICGMAQLKLLSSFTKDDALNYQGGR
jgi:hypothetical protein